MIKWVVWWLIFLSIPILGPILVINFIPAGGLYGVKRKRNIIDWTKVESYKCSTHQ